MVGRTNCGVSNGSKTVTINAPKSSTVAWSGTASGSASTGSVTQITVTLKVGTYTFTCTHSSTVIFTKTVAITGNMTVNLYPDGAIYWYGMQFVSFVGTTNYSSVQAKDDYLLIGTSQRGNEGARTSSQVSLTGKTKLYADVYASGSLPANTNNPQARLWTSTTSAPWNTDSKGSWAKANTRTKILTGISTSGNAYVGIHFTPSAYSSTYCNLYAMWLE